MDSEFTFMPLGRKIGILGYEGYFNLLSCIQSFFFLKKLFCFMFNFLFYFLLKK